MFAFNSPQILNSLNVNEMPKQQNSNELKIFDKEGNPKNYVLYSNTIRSHCLTVVIETDSMEIIQPTSLQPKKKKKKSFSILAKKKYNKEGTFTLDKKGVSFQTQCMHFKNRRTQMWNLSKTKDNNFRIINVATGLFLTYGIKDNQVKVTANNGLENQLFKLEKIEGIGTLDILIESVLDQTCLDSDDDSLENGGFSVFFNTKNGLKSQYWNFVSLKDVFKLKQSIYAKELKFSGQKESPLTTGLKRMKIKETKIHQSKSATEIHDTEEEEIKSMDMVFTFVRKNNRNEIMCFDNDRKNEIIIVDKRKIPELEDKHYWRWIDGKIQNCSNLQFIHYRAASNYFNPTLFLSPISKYSKKKKNDLSTKFIFDGFAFYTRDNRYPIIVNKQKQVVLSKKFRNLDPKEEWILSVKYEEK